MSNSSESNQWYAHWFDSSFYHVLYAQRNHSEAEAFVGALMGYLSPAPSSRILDLACGKGRHSRAMHARGYNVTGVDLSPQSIRLAQQDGANGLQFAVHDMREVYAPQAFDLVVSLFTSFGYFDDPADDVRVITSVAESLAPNGRFVLDFLNAHQVINQLVPEEVVEREGTTFHINRSVQDGKIVKTISFQADGRQREYSEQVRAYNKEELTQLFTEAGFTVLDVLGNYQLEPYQALHSDRLILVAERG